MMLLSSFGVLAYPVAAMLTTTACWLLTAGGVTLWGRGRRATRAADTIIVPGCPARPDGTPSPALARRVDMAVKLFHDGQATRLMVSGHNGEATVGLEHARAGGVPESALIAEPAASNTRENAAFASPILGDCAIIIVSDDYHLLRCHLLFRRHFTDVQTHSAGSSYLRMSVREVAGLLMSWR